MVYWPEIHMFPDKENDGANVRYLMQRWGGSWCSRSVLAVIVMAAETCGAVDVDVDVDIYIAYCMDEIPDHILRTIASPPTF